ncbi:MAG: hypothetical protein Q4A18_03440, partial [Rikenellaceae bacterium]|nr:hypothetical protein [Rikenellaceae bacterium]
EVEPAPEVETAPEPIPVSEQPLATAKNLFGEEPEVERHRRKQRVIMSLYDVAIVDKPRAEEPKKEELKPMPVVEEEPEAQIIEVDEEDLDDTMPVETVAEESIADTEPAYKPLETPQSVEQPAATVVLGETIQPRQTLADTIKPQTGVGEAIRRQPITDLRRAVGLNDKFLLIRDLFGGNGSLYEITIRKLNEFTTFDDCIIYITEHFHWNPNLDGTKLMMDLLERKFDQQ